MHAFPSGDGLAVFCRDVTETKHAEQRVLAAAQHILNALSRPFEIDALDLSISACIGISEFPLHGTDVALLRWEKC